MPIIGVKLGLTLQVGEREFFRPEVSIEQINTAFPIEPQIKAAKEGLAVIFDETAAMLLTKVDDYLKGKK